MAQNSCKEEVGCKQGLETMQELEEEDGKKAGRMYSLGSAAWAERTYQPAGNFKIRNTVY